MVNAFFFVNFLLFKITFVAILPDCEVHCAAGLSLDASNIYVVFDFGLLTLWSERM